MCKQYQIEYTCQHTRTIETAFCNRAKSSSLLHAITLHPQHAPHKCPPCRTYDRDRWRRGWPPIPLPSPPAPPTPKARPTSRNTAPRTRARAGTRKIADETGNEEDEDDFAVDFQELTAMVKERGRGEEVQEHDEESGGVGLGLGLGAGLGIGESERAFMSGGLNSDDTGSSEGFGLGIDGAGGGGEFDSVDTMKTVTTTSTPMTPKRLSNETAYERIRRMRAQSFAEGVENGIRGEQRARFGGFGGRKLRERRASTVEMGGVPMERTVSNRGSLPSRSSPGSSYRGADMEGGGGLGLGLDIGYASTTDATETDAGSEKQKESEGENPGVDLGLGVGGVAMERDGGMANVERVDAKSWLRKTRRESVFSKSASTSTSEVEGTSDDDMESVTARFLNF